MLTKREIFNKVKNHLLAQGSKALSSDGRCAYRGVAHTKCAAGILIENELYDPVIEGRAVSTMTEGMQGTLNGSTQKCHQKLIDALVASGISEEKFPFVRQLQKIHDSSTVSEWPGLLDKLELSIE